MKKEFVAILDMSMLGVAATLLLLADIPKWKKYFDNELSAKARAALIAKKPAKRSQTFREKIRQATAARGRSILDKIRSRRSR